MRALAGALGVVLASSSVHAADTLTPDEVTGPYTYGTATGVTGLKHLRFGAQPDAAGFRAAKEEGVEIVVNLRGPDEDDFDAESAAKEVGLEYHHVPVVPSQPLSASAFEEIESIVEAARGRKVYIYCASGNRASAWLATHLVGRHGLSRDDAFAVAERTGLTKAPLRKATEEYLDRSAGDRTPEESP